LVLRGEKKRLKGDTVNEMLRPTGMKGGLHSPEDKKVNSARIQVEGKGTILQLVQRKVIPRDDAREGKPLSIRFDLGIWTNPPEERRWQSSCHKMEGAWITCAKEQSGGGSGQRLSLQIRSQNQGPDGRMEYLGDWVVAKLPLN